MRYRTKMAFANTKLLLSLLSLTLLIASSTFADDEVTEKPDEVAPGDGHVPDEEAKNHGAVSAKPNGHSSPPDLENLDESDEGTKIASETLSAEAEKYKSNAKNMTDKIKEMNDTSDMECDIGLHEKLGEFIRVYKEDEELAFHREDTVYAGLNKIYDEKLAKAEKFCQEDFVCSDGSSDNDGESTTASAGDEKPKPTTPKTEVKEPSNDADQKEEKRRRRRDADKSNQTTSGKCKACFEKSGDSNFVLSFIPFKSDGSENSDYKQCFNMAKPNPVINIQGASGIVSPLGVMSLLSTALMGLVASV